MSSLRTLKGVGEIKIIKSSTPFSNYKFIEENFEQIYGCPPLRRIFSIARSGKFSTFILEEIQSEYFSAEDDLDLQENGFTPSKRNLIRISFFTSEIKTVSEIRNIKNSDYLGYAILKEVPYKDGHRWVIFEAILNPSRHDNNCYHGKRKYEVLCNEKIFTIEGNLYCQQNEKTNVCAHVALRSVLSVLLPEADVSYRTINGILSDHKVPFGGPGYGLSHAQIQIVLKHFEINFESFWYSRRPSIREFIRVIIDRKLTIVEKVKLLVRMSNQRTVSSDISYQKHIYGSIESGLPSLLGFSTARSAHIIPILGHTFNQDTWVPSAETEYMSLGELSYIPSDFWLSTFICHDDNFGQHFCLPRHYLTDKNNVLVISVLPFKAKYNAAFAEAISIEYLHKILQKHIQHQISIDHEWLKRLLNAILNKRVVLRSKFMTGTEYIEHLKQIKGWNGEVLEARLLEGLENNLKGSYWVIEISLQELFAANKRKLGEVVLNAEIDIDSQGKEATYMFARLPGSLCALIKQDGKVNLANFPLSITSHSLLKDVRDDRD